MTEFLNSLLRILADIGDLFLILWKPLLFAAPWLLWFVFCLLVLNWKKMWATLKEGAWIPATLLIVLAALACSQASPRPDPLFKTVPNFWWQLGFVGLVAAVGLFAGWLQGRYFWTPIEMAVEPPAHGHGHGHGHGHDHDHGHGHADTPHATVAAETHGQGHH